MKKPGTLAFAVVLALASGPAWPDGTTVPEPPGYRLDNYRAPVPLSVAGGRAIDTAEAKALWQ